MMFTQAVLTLLTASAAVAATIGNRYESSSLTTSSSVIARKIRKCQGSPPPTVYFPLNFRYGSDQKITTDLVIPGSNKTMPVCFDQGSETFWFLEQGAVYNWGSERLATPGPCNISAAPVYDYSGSPDATTAPSDYFNAAKTVFQSF
ncbi:hypothetical protein CHU98_g7500 [Xylaria longipes]|nr:hypothetical protein CHU98_g7500 [Xylaria longipes]